MNLNTIEKNIVENININDFSLQSIGVYMMFGSVDDESSQNLCEFLIKSNYIFPSTQPLTIMINSPGGDVYSGLGVIDLMECSRLKIQTVSIGMVASMAAIIFTTGTKGMRTMSRNSFIMTHQFNNWFEGKYHEIIARREHDDDLHHRFIQHFMRHSMMSEKQINDILLGSSDRYISATDALKYGLCDRIQDPWV